MPRSADPIFFPGSQKDYEINQLVESNYQDSITQLQEQWYQADLDQRTYLGDPNIWGVLYPNNYNVRKKMFNFNLTHASVMMVTGHQRRNRKATITIPVISPVQQTADQFTKCLYYVHKQNGYQVYSDAFEQGAIVQGFGLISIFPDFSCDPVSPEIKMRYVDFKSVMIDPWFRNKDLSDCRYIWTRQYFSKKEAMLYYPDFADEFADISSQGFKDDKFYYMPENYNLQMKDIIAVDEYWYLSQREATYVIDNLTEETKEIEGDEEDIRVAMMEIGDRARIERRPKQTVRRCIRVNNRVLVDEERPYGLDRYSYVGVYGNFNPDTQYYGYKFKGLVRDLRDANFLFNITKITDLDILQSQQQGLKVKKGALITPDDSLNQGNGRVLVINDKMQMDDVQPMQIIPPSPVMLQMEDMLKSVMREISGINEELLGSAVDDKAGVLSMLRQSAGLTTLQKYFDQMDQSQTECGDIIIQMIQNFWTYGKVKSVIGEEPTPEFDNKAFFKYGAKVIQGVLTETQEQLELSQLFELQQRFGEIFPPDEIVDAMTIQNKDRIKEKMAKAQEQQQQQAQQQAQAQQQSMEIENQAKMADAQSKQALGQERIAKIQSDMAIAEDKMKRAQTEETASLLNVIKAIKELEGMDLDQIAKSLSLLQTLQPEVTESPSVLNDV
jgi:hypothetical protein